MNPLHAASNECGWRLMTAHGRSEGSVALGDFRLAASGINFVAVIGAPPDAGALAGLERVQPAPAVADERVLVGGEFHPNPIGQQGSCSGGCCSVECGSAVGCRSE